MPNGLILRFAWPGALLLLLCVAGLTLFALFRNARRRLQGRHLLELGSEVQPLLGALLAGSIEYEDVLRQLRALGAKSRPASLENWLMADRDLSADKVPLLRRLCDDLGLIAPWQGRLVAEGSQSPAQNRHDGRAGGRVHPLGFVLRAEAAENLGIIRHRPSWPLLVEALADPHATVRSAAARALAQIGEPESFSGLAERLRSAALDPVPPISSASLKMALAAFPLSEASRLNALLEDPCWQVRSLAAGIVSAMAEQEAAACAKQERELPPLEPELAEIFLGRLAFDKSPEVRARVVDVAGYIDDSRCVPLLRALANDPEWFVRLRAVRALARHNLTPPSAFSRCLTDPNWRVREAAAEELCALGGPGVSVLLDHFSTTRDRYSREQIAEQIGKAGLLPSLLETFGDPGRGGDASLSKGWSASEKVEALLTALGNRATRKDSEAVGSEFCLNSDATLSVLPKVSTTGT
jgi:HEAT repeat protein